MAYLGLVPSEHSSGRTVHRAGITKAGNTLARRALIEGARTYRMQPRVSRKLHDRIEALPQTVRDIAWKAQIRVCARYRRLAATGKARLHNGLTRLGGAKGRMKKVLIVALMRKLVIALWRLAETGEVPIGARLAAR